MSDQGRLHFVAHDILYCVVVGAMLLKFIESVAYGEWRFDAKLALVIFLLVYFISQCVEHAMEKHSYGLLLFVIDVGECGVMFLLFILLGVYDLKMPSMLTQSGWTTVYVLLAIVFLAPVLRRIRRNGREAFTEDGKWELSLMSLTATEIAILGIVPLDLDLVVVLLGGVLLLYIRHIYVHRHTISKVLKG